MSIEQDAVDAVKLAEIKADSESLAVLTVRSATALGLYYKTLIGSGVPEHYAHQHTLAFNDGYLTRLFGLGCGGHGGEA